MKESDVFVHTEPTKNELRCAFVEMKAAEALQFLPDWLRSLKGWMRCMMPKKGKRNSLSFFPIVVEVDGRYPAVIWLTNYCAENRFAVIHFAAHAQVRPKTVFLTCRLVVDGLLRSDKIDVLQAVFNKKDVGAAAMARAFGFEIFARSPSGCVYSARAKDFNYGKNTKGTKAGRGGAGGGAGDAGE